MDARITISLLPAEKAALTQLAVSERRGPRAQMAWIIRRELEPLVLLQPTTSQPTPESEIIKYEHQPA